SPDDLISLQPRLTQIAAWHHDVHIHFCISLELHTFPTTRPNKMKFIAFVLASATAASQSISTLSTKERADLMSDLAKWHSNFGATALKEGLLPHAQKTQDDLLQRLLDTKLAVAEASRTNPDAIFSWENKFALMNDAEFKQYVQVSFQSGNKSLRQAKDAPSAAGAVVAATVDWTTRCNPPVRDQGACGSCWAHAAVGVAEAAHCLATGELLSLSVQQVTSCSTEGGSQGCEGGFPWYAIDYVNQEGLCLDSDWPYAAQTGTCDGQCNKQHLQIGSSVRGNGESGLVNGLNNQPVSVVVEAGNSVWKNYQGGVVSQCPGAQSDHAVIAVAYDGQSYTIKNSWGTGWGESGYMRLARNTGSTGTCNVGEAPTWPQLSSNPNPTPSHGPTPVPSSTQPPSQCGDCDACLFSYFNQCYSDFSSSDCAYYGGVWCGH
ncbi:hypothetical protein As57867_017352, partial [Aphanomyces stellatus]